MQHPSKSDDPPARRSAAVFEGELAVLGLGEVLQMICVGRQRLWVDVWSGDERVGSLVVADGEIVGCATMGYGGDDAFFALASRRRGKFKVHAATAEDLSVLPATARSWQELLLESARLQDESERASEVQSGEREGERQEARERLGSWFPPPISGDVPAGTGPEDAPPTMPTALPLVATMPAPPAPVSVAPVSPLASLESVPPRPSSSVPSVTPPPVSVWTPLPPVVAGSPPSEADRLLNAATEAYLKRQYAEALRLFTECLALRPGDRQIMHNIERLKKRGK